MPKREPVVCLVTAEKPRYSETFIQAHIEDLPARLELVHLSGGAWRGGNGLPLLPKFERLALAIAREFCTDAVAMEARAFGRYLKRRHVQAVLAEYGPVGVRVFRACAVTKIPLVVHFHGFDAYQAQCLDRNVRDYRDMFAVATAIVAVSNDMKEQLVAIGAPREKIAYCPCGVDLAVFSGARPGTAPATFLAVGRFVEKKAPHLTLLAFQKVVQSNPDARLIFAGDGKLQHACRQIVTALHLDRYVSFRGAVTHAEVASLMREVRCFVQHSVRAGDGNSEGTPVAVVEAGAAGLPVVATAHAGICEAVVHGQTGFLVPEGDIDGMAHFMNMLASDAVRAEQMGKAARVHVSAHFAREGSISRLWTVIGGAIAQTSPNQEDQ